VLNISNSTVGSKWVSLASNATSADGPTLLRIVPHWFRVFGQRLREVVIIVDREPLVGRIAELQHGQSHPDELEHAIRELEWADPRVRFVDLQSLDRAAIQRRWFGNARPVRCQAGTPILAFAAAVDQASENIVLRCDSDMLFCESGWLDEAIASLHQGIDLYEPPRLNLGEDAAVSSRAFVVAKQSFYARLPLRRLRLDALRLLHRMIKRRPPWIALEQMMTCSVAKGQLSHRVGRNTDLGFSLHGLKRSYIASPGFLDVVRSIEAGQVPAQQRNSWDFHPDHWGIQVL
jgi:hypothetical protein